MPLGLRLARLGQNGSPPFAPAIPLAAINEVQRVHAIDANKQYVLNTTIPVAISVIAALGHWKLLVTDIKPNKKAETEQTIPEFLLIRILFSFADE